MRSRSRLKCPILILQTIFFCFDAASAQEPVRPLVTSEPTRLRKAPTAIVLSGGGAKGSFEVGALGFLYRRRGVSAQVIAGTSVGAINAAKLAEGFDHEKQLEALNELEDIWLGLRKNEDMYTETHWLGVLKEKVPELYNRIKTDLENLDSAHGLWRLFAGINLITDLLTTKKELGDLEPLISEIRGARSLYLLKPIAQKLSNKQILDPEAVRRSGVALRLGIVGLGSGLHYYATQTGELIRAPYQESPFTVASWGDGAKALLGGGGQGGLPPQLDRGRFPPPPQPPQPGGPLGLVNAILASAAIPVIFNPVQYGELLVDGGVRDVVPLDAVLEFDPEDVYVIVATKRRLSRVNPLTGGFGLPIAGILERTTDVMTHENIRGDFQHLGELPYVDYPSAPVVLTHPHTGRQMRLTVIAPETDLGNALTVDPGLVRISIAYGFMRAAEVLTDGVNTADPESGAATRIARLRYEIWKLETDYHDSASIPHKIQELQRKQKQPGLPGTVWAKYQKEIKELEKRLKQLRACDVLYREIRQKKNVLAGLVKRLANGMAPREAHGMSPRDAQSWSGGWEKHTWTEENDIPQIEPFSDICPRS